jgi:hypothetical protein
MDFTKERAMSRSSTAGSNPRNLSEARKTIEVRVRRASRFIETMSRYPRYGLPCPSVPSAFVGGRICRWNSAARGVGERPKIHVTDGFIMDLFDGWCDKCDLRDDSLSWCGRRDSVEVRVCHSGGMHRSMPGGESANLDMAARESKSLPSVLVGGRPGLLPESGLHMIMSQAISIIYAISFQIEDVHEDRDLSALRP